MYAIRNKKTKKWVYGTDFRVPHRKVKPRKEEAFYFNNQQVIFYDDNPHAYISYSQRTSFDQALTFDTLGYAIAEFNHRGCGNDYEIVKVKLIVDGVL